MTWRCMRTFPFLSKIEKCVAPGFLGTTTSVCAESASMFIWAGEPMMMLPISSLNWMSSDLSGVRLIAGCVSLTVESGISLCVTGGRMSIVLFSAKLYDGAVKSPAMMRGVSIINFVVLIIFISEGSGWRNIYTLYYTPKLIKLHLFFLWSICKGVLFGMVFRGEGVIVIFF